MTRLILRAYLKTKTFDQRFKNFGTASKRFGTMAVGSVGFGPSLRIRSGAISRSEMPQ